MKKINLVHVTSSLAFGGAETVLCEIIQHLDPKIFNQSVIYFHDGPHVERLKDLGVPAYKIQGIFFRYDLFFWIRLLRCLKKIKPDCIHSLLWSANFAVRLVGTWLKIPFVNAFHNDACLLGTVRSALDRITTRLADRFIAVSPQVAESMTWISAQKVHLIANGIDAHNVLIQGMYYKKTRNELELSDEQFIIGAVGRLIPIKRFDLLLESFALINAQFPLSRLIIIGSGPEEKALKKKAVMLGIDQDVLFAQGKPYGYYPIFDCFVLPSASEGISIALLEACSFSLPCIVTHHGPHPVLQSGYNGIVVDTHKPGPLAREIGSLIQSPDSGYALGNNAYKTVNELFKLSTMVHHYSVLFTQLVDEK